MDKKIELLNALYQATEVVKAALELRQQAQLTNGIIDRNLCDSMINHSAKIMKDVISELGKV